MQSIIITGSTSGIGFAIAKKFAAEKFRIVINGLSDAQTVAGLTAELMALGAQDVFYHGANLLKPDECRRLIQDSINKFQTIDVLVNNAGIQFVSDIENFPDNKWDEIIAINLSAIFHTTKAVVPHMKNNKFGRIINVASAHGLVASKQKSAYVAAKHGVVGFTKSIGVELANSGITVNAICPGWVLTPLVEKQIYDMAAQKNITQIEAQNILLSEKQPMLKFTKPEQLAELAWFLSSQAAATMTAAAISMDGGWTAC